MKIKCTISTPQYKNMEVYRWHKQSGIFDCQTLKFEPYHSLNGNHWVQFSSITDFEKYKVDDTKLSNKHKAIQIIKYVLVSIIIICSIIFLINHLNK